MAFPLHL
jgi:hypothetical protein